MLVSAIVAIDRNRVIGHEGEIPWYLPGDLKFFKRTTLDHHVIMGRKTFESIGRPLPKRTNIVLTRDPFYAASGVLVARSVEEALELAYDDGEEEAFIIGGEEIYRQTLPYLDRIYLTEVHTAVAQGTAFFPELPAGEWGEVSREPHPVDEKNEFAYDIVVLERVSGGDFSRQAEEE